MASRRVPRMLAVATAITMVSSTVPASVGDTPPPHAAGSPALAAVVSPAQARRVAPGCATRLAPVQPTAELPWAQQRYAPDRLLPLATGAGVTVAVIDSGVDDGHAQLRKQTLDGRDYLDPNRNGTLDCAGHGTAVASIIAASVRDGVEFHGLAPEAEILPVRVSEQQIIDGKESGRTVTATEFAQSIRWAVDHGADVINLSVVLYEDSGPVRRAVAYAVKKDVVVVAAVGNLYGTGNPRPYPASYDGVIGVGAIDAEGRRSSFSQVGSYVDIVAPGSGVLTAAPGKGHRRQDGTSYAAPFVSATAALVLEYRPDLSAAQVADRILATADPAPGGVVSGYGAGVLNPYRAVTETRAAARPESAAAPLEESDDPQRTEREWRQAAARERSLWVAGVGGAVAALTVLLAVVLPRGARRRWRPAGSA